MGRGRVIKTEVLRYPKARCDRTREWCWRLLAPFEQFAARRDGMDNEDNPDNLM